METSNDSLDDQKTLDLLRLKEIANTKVLKQDDHPDQYSEPVALTKLLDDSPIIRPGWMLEEKEDLEKASEDELHIALSMIDLYRVGFLGQVKTHFMDMFKEKGNTSLPADIANNVKKIVVENLLSPDDDDSDLVFHNWADSENGNLPKNELNRINSLIDKVARIEGISSLLS